MKAITVRQPWAWAIAKGYKPIENRTWSTDHRGLIAIHAAAKSVSYVVIDRW
ncbi:ASCH domain-containing protein [Amycolatopsis sp. NPDC006131]|uniref:ASCH domain-containing protein n=1 Tax=Amycolatopsis sp. NPDC006131 TaxID=3156731 RepID=UPI0033B01E77